MSNEKSFYTPDIIEFHVGFEYEEKLPFTDWLKSVCKSAMDINLIENRSAIVRVKHLDHDDIVSLGWEYIRHHRGEEVYKLDKGGVNVFHLFFGSNVAYLKIANINMYMLFSGHLLNKSELKRLMRQLGISKNEQP